MSSKVTRRSVRQEKMKEAGGNEMTNSSSGDADALKKSRGMNASKENSPEKPTRKASGVKVIPNRKSKTVKAKKNTTDWVAKLLSSSEWAVGDLVWARMRGSPYWPSLVTVDPASGQYQKTGPAHGKKKLVHVTFFANGAKHSWVPFDCTTKFEGLTSYQLMISQLEMPKRDMKNYFSPKRSMMISWNRAIEEAEACLKQDMNNRLTFLNNTAEVYRQARVGTTKRKSETPHPDAEMAELETSKQV